MAVHAVIGDELKPHLSQLTGSKVSGPDLMTLWKLSSLLMLPTLNFSELSFAFFSPAAF